jgi:hypothetical protein
MSTLQGTAQAVIIPHFDRSNNENAQMALMNNQNSLTFQDSHRSNLTASLEGAPNTLQNSKAKELENTI